jgi:hypothetical protein
MSTPQHHYASGTLRADDSTIELVDLTLPLEFLDRARGFTAAADAASTSLSRGIKTSLPSHAVIAPVAFLLAQSIELALKAFLLHKGYPFAKLRTLSHSIPKAMGDAQGLGFSTPHPTTTTYSIFGQGIFQRKRTP